VLRSMLTTEKGTLLRSASSWLRCQLRKRFRALPEGSLGHRAILFLSAWWLTQVISEPITRNPLLVSRLRAHKISSGSLEPPGATHRDDLAEELVVPQICLSQGRGIGRIEFRIWSYDFQREGKTGYLNTYHQVNKSTITVQYAVRYRTGVSNATEKSRYNVRQLHSPVGIWHSS